MRVRRLTRISVALMPASDPPEMVRLWGVADRAMQADLEVARRAAGRRDRPSWRRMSVAVVLGWLP